MRRRWACSGLNSLMALRFTRPNVDSWSLTRHARAACTRDARTALQEELGVSRREADDEARAAVVDASSWTQRPKHGSFASIEWGVGGRRGIFVFVGYMEIAAAVKRVV